MSDSSERAVRNAKTPVKFSTYNEGDCDNEPHAAVLPPHGIANTLCLVGQATVLNVELALQGERRVVSSACIRVPSF